MAQISSLVGTSLRPVYNAENTATIPATGNTVITTNILQGMIQNLGVSFTVGVNNLDAFVVEIQFHQDGPWITYTSAITSTPAGLIIGASGTLATTAAGATAWFLMDVRGLYGVRISASGTVADTTTVAMYVSGS